jgi:hypothetical protein
MMALIINHLHIILKINIEKFWEITLILIFLRTEHEMMSEASGNMSIEQALCGLYLTK